MSNRKAALLFDELRSLSDRSLSLKSRYLSLNELLRRVCIAETEDFPTEFSGLFSRLYALCRAHSLDIRPVDHVRRHVRRVLAGEAVGCEEDYRQDWAVLCHWVADLYDESLPADLDMRIAAPVPGAAGVVPRSTCLRLTVVQVEDDSLLTIATDAAQAMTYRVICQPDDAILHQAEPSTQINVLDYTCQGQELHPTMIVLDPDFLLDVSALAACVKPYGSHPFNYLLSKFTPHDVTLPILLGNAANSFMDDCVNGAPSDDFAEGFKRAVKKHFGESLLEYVALADKVGEGYVRDAYDHYQHIRDAVDHRFERPEVGLSRESLVLEPSFICEAMGLRGRLDVMSLDHRNVVELKSGRADDFGHPPRPRPEHTLQMALYKAILHYNFGLPYSQVRTFLLYSRYPLLYDERSSGDEVARAMALRNAIVYMERRLRQGGFAQMLSQLTVETLNENDMTGRLFDNYLRPSLERICTVFQQSASVVKGKPCLSGRYFQAFLAFLEREQFLSKTGDNRPDSTRGFARVWREGMAAKLSAGDALEGLRLCELSGDGAIERLTFALPEGGPDVLPNFNEGEMVQLYERNTPGDNVTNRQLFRAYVERLMADRLVVRLAYAQRNRAVLPPDSRYAMERDSSDTTFTQCYRGLYQFLTAPDERRQLLLGQRRPRTNRDVRLCGRYLNATIDDIVLAAKQAEDFFLLVGPPGTGKTNVALRAMVEEFLLERAEAPDACLLLTAYTNRAVDEICHMLSAVTSGVDYVRIGAEQTCAEPYRSRLLPNWAAGDERLVALRDRLAAVPVVVGTVATLTAHAELFRLKRFTAAIVDEAAQILEPQLLGLLCCAPDGEPAIRKFVMIGDHRQLPAVVMQSPASTVVRDEWLRRIGLTDLSRSLFERLLRQAQAAGDDRCWAMLDRQGRMHGDISRVASHLFYGDRLRPVPLPHQDGPLPFAPSDDALMRAVASARLGFVDVVPGLPAENNKVNPAEAEVIAALVETLYRLYARSGLPFDPDAQVGVIVPFRGQITAVRRSLAARHLPGCEHITVDTVECFQGSQRDHILFGTTVRYPYQLQLLSSTETIDGATVDRKLNVALTRARLQLIVVGHGALLSASPVYRALLAETTPIDYSFIHHFNPSTP